MKSEISRREFLKGAGLLGATLLLPGAFKPDRLDGATFILYTDDPEKGIRSLVEKIAKDYDIQYIIKRNSIELYSLTKSYNVVYYTEKCGKTNKDLTIILNDTVIDPMSIKHRNNIKSFTENLRRSSTKANWKVFLNIEKNNLSSLLTSYKSHKSIAEVYVNGKLIERLDLRKSYVEIPIAGYAGKSILEVKNGMIRVSNSICRNKLCVHEGAKRYGNIVCAPNKLYIKLPDLKKVDAITL